MSQIFFNAVLSKKKKLIFIVLILLPLYIYSLDYTIAPNTYSIQSGDFDNDGDDDIVVGHINPGTISFITNNGDGLFNLIDTLSLTGIAECYFLKNLDDNPAKDAAIHTRNDITRFVTIIYNGEYQSPYSYNLNINNPIPAMNCGDFDGDSDYDLVFSSWGSGYDNLWGVMYNLGNREFSDPEWFECPSQAGNAGFYELECRDLDNNGFDDIIAYTNLETYIYYSDGYFFELDSLNCYAPNGGLVSEDYDNDSDYDIIITHWPGGTQSHFLIYENLGDQQYDLHDVTYDNLWGQPISVEINGDGLDDIVNVGNINGIGIFYNIGNMQFDEAVYEPVVSYGENYFRSSFSDFDDNGTQDVAIIRYGIEENNLTILYNDGDGNFYEEPVSVENSQIQITKYHLTNFPNPFNPAVAGAGRSPGTTISYDLPVNIVNPVIEIFNIKEEKVRELPIVTPSPAHTLSVTWDGTDQYRNQVASGVYFYKLNVNGKSESVRKCLLLK
jgi:hypothetical protein